MRTTLTKYIEDVDYFDLGYWPIRNKNLHLYQDNLTKSSFTVNASEGETIEKKLNEVRKMFEEGNK
jgi:hypothetical protein